MLYAQTDEQYMGSSLQYIATGEILLRLFYRTGMMMMMMMMMMMRTTTTTTTIIIIIVIIIIIIAVSQHSMSQLFHMHTCADVHVLLTAAAFSLLSPRAQTWASNRSCKRRGLVIRKE